MLIRLQFLLTLVLMPITFGIWYAAGPLFSAPAVWLYDMFTGLTYPAVLHSAGLKGIDSFLNLNCVLRACFLNHIDPSMISFLGTVDIGRH